MINKNPFNTAEFMEFAGIGISTSKNRMGVLNELTDCPLIIENAFFPRIKGEQHVVSTPICLSGPDLFDETVQIAKRQTWIDEHDIVAGFIQTRETSDANRAFLMSRDGNYTIYRDSRTNYRLQLGRSISALLSSMKRDSRQRVKKIIKNKSSYELEPCDSQFEEGVYKFANMYSALAERQCFSSSYVFGLQDWMTLLKSELWTLYLLYYESAMIAGTVVAKLSHGYDYTFMAVDPSYRDASRALVIFLYEYLTEKSNGYLDLGGGITENDQLSRFKSGLGADPVYFKRIKFVDNNCVPKIVDRESIKKAMLGRWPIQNAAQRKKENV